MRELTTLRLDERGDIATITLNRPDVGNRVNRVFLQEFQEVCHYLEDASTARIVVIRGSGDHFCRGIDFEDFDPQKPLDIHGFNKWEKSVRTLERLPKVTIAALHGEVRGGGFQLALACDQRVALPETRLSLPELHLGFLPGLSVYRLAKYIGLGRAKKLLLTAQVLEARQAEFLGLLDAVVADLDAGIAATVESLGPVHVVAIELARRLLKESFHDSYEDAIGHFLAAQHRAISQTAFLDTLRKVHRAQGED